MGYTIIVILLIVLMFGAIPAWPYSHDWGYYPMSGLGALVIIVILIALFWR